MIKIKESKNNWVGKKFKCENCGAVFQLEAKDKVYNSSAWWWVFCPNCNWNNGIAKNWFWRLLGQ